MCSCVLVGCSLCRLCVPPSFTLAMQRNVVRGDCTPQGSVSILVDGVSRLVRMMHLLLALGLSSVMLSAL